MTTPSITLDQSQTLTTPAMQETPKRGSLEGRSIVPCPSKRWLTDVQIKRIALVALAIFATVGLATLGATFTLLLGVGSIGLTLGLIGATIGGIPTAILWPKVDFQTPKGAERIRNDLKTKDLATLYKDYGSNYSFSKLAKYGYISKESAIKMKSLKLKLPEVFRHSDPRVMNHVLIEQMALAQRPSHYPRYRFVFYYGGEYDKERSERVNKQLGVYEIEAKIEAKFNALRSQPGFLL